MHLTSSRARLAGWIALPLAVVASGAVIATASYASFSASTENEGNAWTSGKVALADDDQGTALFDVSGIAPGDADTECITVSSTSTVDSTVRMYTADSSTANPLSDQLQVTVHVADAGTACADAATGTPAFDGSLTALTAKNTFADGIGSWDTGETDSSRVVRIAYALPATADNTAQDRTASTTFVWQAESK